MYYVYQTTFHPPGHLLLSEAFRENSIKQVRHLLRVKGDDAQQRWLLPAFGPFVGRLANGVYLVLPCAGTPSASQIIRGWSAAIQRLSTPHETHSPPLAVLYQRVLYSLEVPDGMQYVGRVPITRWMHEWLAHARADEVIVYNLVSDPDGSDRWIEYELHLGEWQ